MVEDVYFFSIPTPVRTANFRLRQQVSWLTPGNIRIVVCIAVACSDSEMVGYIRPVSGQRLGKHVPATTVTHAAGCCLRGPCKVVINKRTGAISSVELCKGS
jgi:hypothetical protein